MESSKYIFKKLTPINDADLKIYEDALNFCIPRRGLEKCSNNRPI